MNPLQMAQQTKWELQQVAWDAGSQAKVFGDRNVFVFAGTPTERQMPASFPWAAVSIGSGTPDPDHPELITQSFTVYVAAQVLGDPEGEYALIGGAMQDTGQSAGRGAFEVITRAREAVENLTGIDGAKIILSSSSTAGAVTVSQRGRHVAMAEIGLSALCTSSPHYAAPQKLARSGTTFSWAGSHCESRYDFLQYRLVAKSGGGTPSQTPTDGTVVYTGTSPSCTSTASASYFTVFADYVFRKGRTDPDASSSPEVGSYL